MAKATTEITRRVFLEGAGIYLEVSPSFNSRGLVRVLATGEENVYCFGDVDMNLCPEYAIELGKALIATAGELLKGEQP